MKEVYLLIQEFWPEGWAYGGALMEWRLVVKSLYSSSASFQLTLISQKGAYTLVWSPDFCDGQATSGLLSSGGQQGLYLWYTGLYIFVCSKICCLRIWFIISLNLGTESRS